MTIRRYRETAAVVLARINAQLPPGAQATSVSVPEPRQFVDIDVPAGGNDDLDGFMSTLGYEFVESAPATTVQQAAVSNLEAIGVQSSDFRDVIVLDHFLSSNNDPDEAGIMGWREFKSGTGNNISYEQAVPGHPGIVRLNGGVGNNSRAALGLGDSSGTGARMVPSAVNPIVVEMLVRYPAASDLLQANLLETTLGLGLEWNDNNELNDGIYFRYSPAIDSFWTGVCANAGARATRASAVAPAANTWYRLGISILSSGVQFLINGVPFGTPITTNIPLGGTGFGLKIRSNGGSGCRLDVDYVLVTQKTDKET